MKRRSYTRRLRSTNSAGCSSVASAVRQKRERFATLPTQLPLDFGATLSEQEIKELEEFINKKAESVNQISDADRARAVHPDRLPLPKHLSVQELVLEPEKDATGMVLIGKEVTDCLPYAPSRFYIQRILRPKYAPKAVIYRSIQC